MYSFCSQATAVCNGDVFPKFSGQATIQEVKFVSNSLEQISVQTVTYNILETQKMF